MYSPCRAALHLFLVTGICSPLLAFSQASSQPRIRHVQVLGNKVPVEIEIEASDRILPQTQVLTGPDRLIVDFPNAVLGTEFRSQSINRGNVKDVRIALFQSAPPITRVVFDLNAPLNYQVFPSGRTTIIKIGRESAGPISLASPGIKSDPQLDQAPEGVEDFPALAAVPARTKPVNRPLAVRPGARPVLDVAFQDGLLSIWANKVSLSQILSAIRERTGADIAEPAGAAQDQIVADISAAPAPEVIARLLNGSRFNFLIVSSAADPRKLDRVILTPRVDGGAPPPALPSTRENAYVSPSPTEPPEPVVPGSPQMGALASPDTDDPTPPPPPPESDGGPNQN
jgi:AMIN domain